MRRISLLLAVFAVTLPAAAAERGFEVITPRWVDLDRPGARGALEAAGTEESRAILGLLKAAEKMPCEGDELKVLLARHEVGRYRCESYLLTSYPAQRVVTFVHKDVGYKATVRVDAPAGFAPVDEATGPRRPGSPAR